MRLLLRILLGLVLLPVAYALLALLLGLVPVNRSGLTDEAHTIHLTTNGVHLHLILERQHLSPALKHGLPLDADTRHVGFGWGDADFYLNTPEWSDLTPRRALMAAFIPSRTLVHVTRHRRPGSDWIAVPVSAQQLAALDAFLVEAFATDEAGHKRMLPDAGYDLNDDFLHATGHYTALRTCNTWVNDALKQAGLPACLWTPFDFAVLRLYR
jgi:uncharacterized protein (TIGR02117 family)